MKDRTHDEATAELFQKNPAFSGTRRRPNHADLRARAPQLTTTSAELVRAERDEC